MNTKTLPISKARQRIFEIAEEIQKPSLFYTLTEKGRPKVVMMSADEFDSWIETLEVMSDFPDLKKDIRQVKRDIANGRYKKYATLDQLLKKESAASRYAIHGQAKKKRGKRI